jgi:PAS domain S-box-containing protein
MEQIDSDNQNVQPVHLSSQQVSLAQICHELEYELIQQTAKIQQIKASLTSQSIARQRAEAALQATDAQLANLLETITDGVCALNRDWEFSYINRRVEQFFKKQPDELLGKVLWDVYPEFVNTAFYHHCYQAVEAGNSLQFETYFDQFERWLQCTIYPSEVGVSLYFQDIGERKQAEQERQKLLEQEHTARIQAEMAEQRCAFLSTVSRELAASLDYKTTISTVIESVVPFLADYCMLQQRQEDGHFQPVAALHHDNSKQPLVEELARCYQQILVHPDSFSAQALRRGEPVLVAEFSPQLATTIIQDLRLLGLLQALQPISVMLLPLTSRGRILGLLLLAMAESGRRYTESDLSLANDLACRSAVAIDNAQLYAQAQESSHLKDQFLNNLSHELRTPLNAILGWAQMLNQRTFDANKTRKATEVIERHAKDLRVRIYDLLDVSRIVTGQLQLNPDWVDLEDVIQAATASLSLAINAKSIEIQQTIQHNSDEERTAPSHSHSSGFWVFGDAQRLYQIIWHLLSNAVKFSPHGGRVAVELSWIDVANSESQSIEPHLTQPRLTQIRIQDWGKGIHSGFLPYVFDRFRQADGSITRAQDGLGLGLSLVKYLVDLHGGTIEVFSDGDGHGTTVVLQFPVPLD